MRTAELVADGSPQELSSRATGTALLVAEIRGPVDDVRRGLAAIEGVKGVTLVRTDDSFSRYELMVTDGKVVAERTFDAAVRAGWTLRELKAETASLEQVFYELTVGEKEEQ